MLIEPVEMEAIGTDGVALAEAHDRALAELLLDLADGDVDGFVAFLLVVERRHAGSFRRPPCARGASAGQAVMNRL